MKTTLRKLTADEKLYKLLENAILLSADIFNDIYNSNRICGYNEAVDEIIKLADEFEKKLDWKEDDQRNYLDELESFECEVKKRYK